MTNPEGASVTGRRPRCLWLICKKRDDPLPSTPAGCTWVSFSKNRDDVASLRTEGHPFDDLEWTEALLQKARLATT